METIRNYLETMFLQMPNTPEVQRAKTELYSMMEDKYTELIKEGKRENEAVGIVISEFGNLDEIAEDLGIGSVVQEAGPVEGRLVSLDEVKDFLSMNARRGYQIALGVLLCICCAVPLIILDSVTNTANMDAFDVAGLILLFVMICGAVGLFIVSGFLSSEWKYLDTQNCYIDYATSQYVEEKRQSFRTTYALMITFGVILCIFSVVPAIIFDTLFGEIEFFEALSGASVLVFVGIGVFLLVHAGVRSGGYEKLLHLNRTGTIGAKFTQSQQNEPEVEYTSKTIAVIMSVYWPTVTCLYFIISFTTFTWATSWLIFPIAAIIHRILHIAYREK